MDEIPDDLILVAKAAQLLGCHVNAIHRAINSGKLPAWKVLGRRKVSRAQLFEQVRRVKVNGEVLPTEEEQRQTRAQREAEVNARLRARGHRI